MEAEAKGHTQKVKGQCERMKREKECRVRTMNREALREMNKKRMKPNRKESMTSCTDSKQKIIHLQASITYFF